MHKHSVVVYEGDAEAAQRRRTRWSHGAHEGERMLGEECKEVGLAFFNVGTGRVACWGLGASSLCLLERG